MTQTATKPPIERFLPQLKGVKSQKYNNRGNPGYMACCPAHNDAEASLLIWEDSIDNHVGIKCFAGCTRRAVVEAVGLTESDLYTDGKEHPAPKDVISLFDLAADKLIPPGFLASLDITDGYTPRAVHIPYHLPDGKQYEKKRIRTALEARRGSFWSKSNLPLIPYGLNRLEQARNAKYLVIVEGESDCWTLWYHGFPSLGVPGAENYAYIALDYLKGIEQVYIMQESDAAGRKFAGEVAKHLLNVGYTGGISILDLKLSHQAKDPNELHKRDWKAFKSAFEQAIQKANIWRKPRKKPKTFLLRDLQDEVLPETKWAIPDILPEGLTILGGKPKMGKSWLALAMLDAIAAGGAALGNIAVEQGDVLYISFEDKKKRLQKRINTYKNNKHVSEHFHYTTEWERIDQGGLDDLAEWIDDHPAVRLIVIDTWARFKPKQQGRIKQLYDEDYDALQPLQDLAGKKGVSILVVDHMRKQESDDPLDMISGSVGKTGAVDGFLLLFRSRGEADASLYVTGKDIEDEREYKLQFSHECASWTIKGDASELASTPERQAILDVLQQSDTPLSMNELAAKMPDKNIYTLRNLMVRLRNENKVTLQNNRYSVVNRSYRSESSYRSYRSETEENAESANYASHSNNHDEIPPVVSTNDFAEMLVEPIHSNGNGHITTITTVTTDEMKRTISTYGAEHGFPRLRLSDGTIIPASKEAWRGFLRYQNHKHQRAYEDIRAGKVVEVQ